MTNVDPALPMLRQATMSVVSLAGGVSLAVVPAATLSIGTRTLPTVEQGYVSVTITISVFVGQLVAAALVESRLSALPVHRGVAFPRWLGALSIIAAIAVMVAYRSSLVLSFALPVLLTSLEVGRTVSVAERLDKREAWAASFVGIGALFGIAVSYLGFEWGFAPLAAGIAAATVARIIPTSVTVRPLNLRIVGWVVTDVAITGIVYPILNAFILIYIGAVQAVLFTAISTVSGLLAIPLNFMRLRLLKAHSALDIWVSAATVLLSAVVIAVLEFAGFLGLIFHSSWTIEATIVPLAIACLWRAASLATTLPFTALRRNGHVRLLALLRAACSLLTFVAGLAVLPTHSLSIVFIVLLAGELIQATTYEVARRLFLARSGADA